MNHIKFGKQFKHYLNPPAIPTDEEIQVFGSNLKAIIEEKLSALNNRDFYILRRNEASIRKIQKLTKPGSPHDWFCIEYAAAEYEEHFYVYRWQKYWLAILDKLEPATLRHLSRGLDIAHAKDFPIDQLYPNQLRQFGGRFNGLCPFHDERTPSLFIFPDNHFYCYGCGEHGDAIDFVMKLKGYEFAEAVRSLT